MNTQPRMRRLARRFLYLGPFAALLCAAIAAAKPLDNVNEYADRCSAELGAGTGSYMPMSILPEPDNFSDSQEVPVFWNQKRITFQETNAGTGAPQPGSGHWEFLFDGMPGAVNFPDGANTVGRIKETNFYDLKCDYWSHVQPSFDACIGGPRNDLACNCPNSTCAGGVCAGGPRSGEACAVANNCGAAGACRTFPLGCFPGQRVLQRDVGTCRGAGPAFERKACKDDTECGNVAGACQDVVTWSFVFRRLKPPKLGRATFDENHPYFFNNFDAVAFKADTGGTCWFDTLEKNGLMTDGWWKDASGAPAGVPRAGGKDTAKKARAVGLWETPKQVRYEGDSGAGDKRCTACHGNGPILHSRWINQGANATVFGQVLQFRVPRSIPYWHPAKLLPNPFFKQAQCGDTCHRAWSVSANTTPGGTLATRMTTDAPRVLSSNFRRQIDNAGAAFAKTCRGKTVNEGQPCTNNAQCPGGTCEVGQNAGILREMPHRYTGTPTDWETDNRADYNALAMCRRTCVAGGRIGKLCAENAECPGSTCGAIPAGCGATVQAVIPAFYGAQSAVPAAPRQLIQPPYVAENVSFARANCVVAADGSETCDAKSQWDDPNPADPESAYHAADKYYLSRTSVDNKPAETPSTMRFCGENVPATPTTAQLGTSNWAKRYTQTNAMAACTKTELRLCGGYFVDSAPDANDAHSPVDSRNDGDAQKGTLVTACANPMQATRSGFRLNRATMRYFQTITLKNTSTAPVSGPVTFLLLNLSANATLFNKTGATVSIVPSGTPFVNVPLDSTNQVAAGASVSFQLEFVNPTNQGITYDARVRTGAGSL